MFSTLQDWFYYSSRFQIMFISFSIFYGFQVTFKDFQFW